MPTAGGIFGGVSRMTIGGRVGGNGGRFPEKVKEKSDCTSGSTYEYKVEEVVVVVVDELP